VQVPEVQMTYKIPWHIVRTDLGRKYVDEICEDICLCGHKSINHEVEMHKDTVFMHDVIIFKVCGSKRFCMCEMYRRDNLKYLERKAIGK
jgi:hypothetical protein